MKVCPSCQARYDQGESFCPNDGEALVDARELSPGQLTGRDLDERVHLDELDSDDDIGERYSGSLLDTERDVRVTVFNRSARPQRDRVSDFEAERKLLGEALPPEILAVHSFNIDLDESPYLIEQPADGRSLAAVLEEKGKLDWRKAVRITAHIAQALHWMAERGHIHRGLHPGAIYVEDFDEGTVRIGDWMQSALTFHGDPLEGAKNGAAFVGFAPYMSPEMINEDGRVDERSLVYSLGMLLYEMVLGKPPFSSESPEETLKRHLHEKPLKLSIAAGSDVHPELDDVLGMMWKKEADERFQTPKAIIAALSTLLDESPHEVASPPSASDQPYFEHDPSDTSADEDTSDDDESDSESNRDTMLGMGPSPTLEEDSDVEESADPGAADASSEVQTGESAIDDGDRDRKTSSQIPSIIIEDPELRTAMGGKKDTDEETEDDSEAAETGDEDDEKSNGVSGDTLATWTKALEAEVDLPDQEAMVMGYVDTKAGIQHNPDGDSVPVQAKNIADPGDGDVQVDAEESSEAPPLPDDAAEHEESGDTEEMYEDDDASDSEAAESDGWDEVAENLEKQNDGDDADEKDGDSIEIDDAAVDGDEANEDESASPDDDADLQVETDDETEDDDAENEDETEDSDTSGVVSGVSSVETTTEDDDEDSETATEDEDDDPSDESDVVVLGETDENEETSAESSDEEEKAEEAEDEEDDADEGEDDEEASIEIADEVDDAEEDEAEEDDDGVETQDDIETSSDVVVLEKKTSDDEESADETDDDTSEEDEAETSATEDESETEEDEESDDQEDQAEVDDDDDDEDDGAGLGVGLFNADGEVETEVTDEWFEVSEEEAWMAADVREGRDQSEVIRRYVTWGIIVLIITSAIGLIAYSQLYTPAEDGASGEQEQSAEE